jgi:hypothetical protein
MIHQCKCHKDNKKSRFKKWIYRLLFLLLLLLFLLAYGHLTLAIETLAKINNDQVNIINDLQQQVHSLQVHTANLQVQSDMMKVKINGLEMANIHNDLPKIDEQTHTATHANLDVLKPIPIITVAAMTVVTVLKGIGSFIPALP